MVTHFQLKAEHFFLYKHTGETYKCPHKILLDQWEHFHNQLLGEVLRTEDANDCYDSVVPGHWEVSGRVCVWSCDAAGFGYSVLIQTTNTYLQQQTHLEETKAQRAERFAADLP